MIETTPKTGYDQMSRNEAINAEHRRLIEVQLDTEELVAGLGAVGLGRLRHPFKTARILFVAAKRMRKGEYNPRLSHTNEVDTSGFFDPFEDDPIGDARDKRRVQRLKIDERRRLIEAGQYINPFEDDVDRWYDDLK